MKFSGKEFSSPFFIAASPITSTTCIKNTPIGWEYDRDELKRKIKFLLQNKFNIGAVILKSVYYPEETESKEELPNTRVWMRGDGKDFFHVGHTPREMFTVDELINFLEEIEKEENEMPNRIIISLGVKHANINKWRELFGKLFVKEIEKKLTSYDVIEINARHTLREINMVYLGDREIDEYVINPVAQAIWNIVFQWFNLLNELGNNNSKRLFIKLPFRSDLIILCQFIEKIIKENKKFGKEFGIKGITLINTIKSPTEDNTVAKSEPQLLLCNEEVKLHQMSGYSLKGIRNWAIRTVKKKFEEIEISASGGLLSKGDIIEAKALGAKTFQLCSMFLKRGLVTKGKKWKELAEKLDDDTPHQEIKDRVRRLEEKIGKPETKLTSRRIYWVKNKCCRCMQCLRTFYCDAFTNKYLVYNKGEKIINGKKFYIPPSFYPKINPNYCTGCGLCIQVCPTGALHYEKYEILLASSSPRRKRLFKEITDKFLTSSSFIREEEIIEKLKSEGKSPTEIAEKIALEKTRTNKCKDFRVIIGADTFVIVNNEIIVKPRNKNDTRRILQKLSDKEHQVITGIAVINTQTDEESTDHDIAKVRIKKLKKQLIEKYIDEKKWEGKAGGYNIEEVESEFGAKVIKGDKDTVIGLPLNKLKELLKQAGLKDLIS